VRLVVAALPNARFVLLGRGNETDTANLVTQPIARLALQRHVVLPGYQKGPDYGAALRSLDAFLFLVPGSDGTCRAVGDALAFGLPVVATRRGILPALLAERRAGETFGVACEEDAEAMAGQLLQLLKDDGLRAARRTAALRTARLDMDPGRAARALRAFYAELLAARGARR
jgi:glycosyltransferase involved in cell wall biosynthesis